MIDIRALTLPKKDIYHDMAIDESLFISASESDVACTLRTYQCNNESMTYGYFQNINDFDFSCMDSHGINYVRRITGGRAVLHGDDMTFSFTAKKDSPFYDTHIVNIKDKFANVLRSFLQCLNIDSRISEKESLKRNSAKRDPYCFNSFTKSEILIDNKKIVGFALKKNSDSFLLQGSIPIRLNIKKISDIMKVKDTFNITNSVTCIEECIEKPYTFDELQEVFFDAFKMEGYNVIKDGLTETEIERADMLVKLKYRDDEWNMRPKKYDEKRRDRNA